MVILDFLVETIVKSSSHTQKDTKYDRGGVKMLHPASHRLAGCNILKRPATLLCLFVSFCVCKEDCTFWMVPTFGPKPALDRFFSVNGF